MSNTKELKSLEATLTQMIAEVKKQPKAKPVPKQKAPVKKEPPPADPRERLYVDPKWAWEALVLLVTEARCSCGSVSQTAHPRPFILRHHPRYGTHLTPIDYYRHDSSWHYLPRRQHIEPVDVPTCQECFTPDHLPDSLQSELNFGQEFIFQSPDKGLFFSRKEN